MAITTALEKLGHAFDLGVAPGIVTIGDAVYTASVVDAGTRNVLTESGWKSQQQVRINIAKFIMIAAPGKLEPVTYDGHSYMIDEVQGAHPSTPTWTLRVHRDV